MLMPCEVAVKSVVPSIRAFVAIELTKTYNMKQNDVAKLLGITQTAVSKYTTQVRGATLRIDQTVETETMMKNLAQRLANGEIKRQDMILQFCDICKTARRQGIMCNLCKRSDPTIDVKTCHVCKSESLACSTI